VKLYVDLTGKRVRVAREPDGVRDEYGEATSGPAASRRMWTTQVYVQDESGGEVITVTTTGDRPNVTVEAIVGRSPWKCSRGARSATDSTAPASPTAPANSNPQGAVP
jgi:hypothetical protein